MMAHVRHRVTMSPGHIVTELLGEGERLLVCLVPGLPPHTTPDTICDALHIRHLISNHNHKPVRSLAQPLHRLAVEIMMLKTGAIFLDL